MCAPKSKEKEKVVTKSPCSTGTNTRSICIDNKCAGVEVQRWVYLKYRWSGCKGMMHRQFHGSGVSMCTDAACSMWRSIIHRYTALKMGAFK